MAKMTRIDRAGAPGILRFEGIDIFKSGLGPDRGTTRLRRMSAGLNYACTYSSSGTATIP
ncbi:MAG: hypothetical protein NVS3B11_11060 [Collimonas sp.]